jgi:hypothetical protein
MNDNNWGIESNKSRMKNRPIILRMIVKRVLEVMRIALLLQHTPSADHKQSKGLLLGDVILSRKKWIYLVLFQ